ncbi:MAG: response regulator [Actinomycetota bacterium]
MVALHTNSGRDVADAVDILVVDNDPDLAALVAELAPGNTHVRAVNDGYQALHAMVEHGAGVVVIELRLPGVSGEEVIRRLHARDASLPVVVVTHAVDSRSILAQGAQVALSKPVAPELLRHVLVEALASAGQLD